eukprot:1731198-Rhodomonas_salina.1
MARDRHPLVKPELAMHAQFFLDCEKTFLTTNTRKYVQTAVKFALKSAYSVNIRHRSLLFTTSGNLYLGGKSGKSYTTALSEVGK